MCALLTSVTVFFPGSLRLSVPPAVWGNWRLGIRQLEGWDTDEGEPSSGGDKREKHVHPKPWKSWSREGGETVVGYGPCSRAAQWQREERSRKEKWVERYVGGGRAEPLVSRESMVFDWKSVSVPLWEQRGQVSQHTGRPALLMLPSRVWGVVVGPSFSRPCGNRDGGTAFLSRGVFRSQSGVCDLARNDGWVGRLAESDQSSLHWAISFPWVTPYLVDLGGGVTLQCAEGRADFVSLDSPSRSPQSSSWGGSRLHVVPQQGPVYWKCISYSGPFLIFLPSTKLHVHFLISLNSPDNWS